MVILEQGWSAALWEGQSEDWSWGGASSETCTLSCVSCPLHLQHPPSEPRHYIQYDHPPTQGAVKSESQSVTTKMLPPLIHSKMPACHQRSMAAPSPSLIQGIARASVGQGSMQVASELSQLQGTFLPLDGQEEETATSLTHIYPTPGTRGSPCHRQAPNKPSWEILFTSMFSWSTKTFFSLFIILVKQIRSAADTPRGSLHTLRSSCSAATLPISARNSGTSAKGRCLSGAQAGVG